MLYVIAAEPRRNLHRVPPFSLGREASAAMLLKASTAQRVQFATSLFKEFQIKAA